MKANNNQHKNVEYRHYGRVFSNFFNEKVWHIKVFLPPNSGVMTFSITTLSITTFSMKTLSIRGLFATLSIMTFSIA
jgi:hypothetical protein